MTALWITLAIVLWLAFIVCVLALCHAAKSEDEYIERMHYHRSP